MKWMVEGVWFCTFHKVPDANIFGVFCLAVQAGLPEQDNTVATKFVQESLFRQFS